jgi:hypothetical protein
MSARSRCLQGCALLLPLLVLAAVGPAAAVARQLSQQLLPESVAPAAEAAACGQLGSSCCCTAKDVGTAFGKSVCCSDPSLDCLYFSRPPSAGEDTPHPTLCLPKQVSAASILAHSPGPCAPYRRGLGQERSHA